MLILNCLFILIYADDFHYPSGWNELQSNKGWKLLKKTKSIQISSKMLESSPLPALKAELITNINADNLIEAAWLVEKSTDIFPNAYIVDAGIYYKRGDTAYSAFQIFDIPMLSPRLYQFNSKRIGYKIHWTRVDTLNLKFNLKNLILPPVNFGSWEIQKIGDKSKIIYRICTDPGGEVPLWLVDMANQRYLPLMLTDIELYAKEKIILK